MCIQEIWFGSSCFDIPNPITNNLFHSIPWTLLGVVHQIHTFQMMNMNAHPLACQHVWRNFEKFMKGTLLSDLFLCRGRWKLSCRFGDSITCHTQSVKNLSTTYFDLFFLPTIGIESFTSICLNIHFAIVSFVADNWWITVRQIFTYRNCCVFCKLPNPLRTDTYFGLFFCQRNINKIFGNIWEQLSCSRFSQMLCLWVVL